MTTDRTDDDRRRDFLRDLRLLTLKHGVAIGGCGCCGSPWLAADVDTQDDRAGYAEPGDSRSDVEWVSPADEYSWKMYADKIIR